jgi:hypothetical protein
MRVAPTLAGGFPDERRLQAATKLGFYSKMAPAPRNAEPYDAIQGPNIIDVFSLWALCLCVRQCLSFFSEFLFGLFTSPAVFASLRE